MTDEITQWLEDQGLSGVAIWDKDGKNWRELPDVLRQFLADHPLSPQRIKAYKATGQRDLYEAVKRDNMPESILGTVRAFMRKIEDEEEANEL